MKIICVNKCYDGRKVYEIGESKEIPDGSPVPAHFRSADAIPEPKVTPTRINPMEPVVFKQNQPVVPNGGMATGLNVSIVNPMPTAGAEAIRKAQAINTEEVSVLKTRGRPRKT